MRTGGLLVSVLVGGVIAATAAGCESLERKFTRKPKTPTERPNPVIVFQDYSQAMTPLERYRKHYLMFGYWNGELLEALQVPALNPKRITRASTESLSELTALRNLLESDLAGRLDPVIEARTAIDRQVQGASFGAAQAIRIVQVVEAQTRQINREFFWRDVQDHLKTDGQAASAPQTP